MRTDPLKVAIVGCGAAFEFLHREPLRFAARKGWLRVIAVADPDNSRRAQATKSFSLSTGYASSKELFRGEPDVDFTIVMSPPPLHESDCLEAFAAGSHVLCEKPLASTFDSAARIDAAARASNRILAVGMTRRFYPAVLKLKGLLEQLPADSDVRFLYRMCGVYNWRVASEAPFRRNTSGGGVLLDSGVHLTDTLGYMLGWGHTTGAWDDATIGGVEANSVVELRLGRGRGRLHLSWDTTAESALHLHVDGQQYWMPVASIDTLYHRNSSGAQWEKLPMDAEWPTDLRATGPLLAAPRSHSECVKFQLVDALRAIRLGTPPAATGADGVAALSLIHSAYQMAQPLQMPWLSSEEQALLNATHWRASNPVGTNPSLLHIWPEVEQPNNLRFAQT